MLQLFRSVSPPPLHCSNGLGSFLLHICTISPRKVGKGPSGHRPSSTDWQYVNNPAATSRASVIFGPQIWLAYFSQLYWPQKLSQLLIALAEFHLAVHSAQKFCWPVCFWDPIFIFVNVFERSDEEMYKHTDAFDLQVERDCVYTGQYWCVLIIHGENASYTQDRRQGAVQSCHRSQSPTCQRKPYTQKPVLLFFLPLWWILRGEKKGRREGERRKKEERQREGGGVNNNNAHVSAS